MPVGTTSRSAKLLHTKVGDLKVVALRTSMQHWAVSVGASIKQAMSSDDDDPYSEQTFFTVLSVLNG